MNRNGNSKFIVEVATLTAALVTVVLGVFAFLGRSPDLVDDEPEQPAPIVIVQPAPVVPAPTPEPQPGPLCPGPGPCPPQPQPRPGPRLPHPLRPREGGQVSAPFGRLPGAPRPAMAQVGSGVKSPDGLETIRDTMDLPARLRMHNQNGRNGQGLCVTTSLNHAANLQSIPCLYDLQKNMRRENGGAGPKDVDHYLPKYCPEIRGKYWQNTSSNIAYLRALIDSGRMPSIFYDGTLDPHYRGQRISHMVNVIHLSEKWACVFDNNYPADKDLVWMRPETLEWMHSGGGRGQGWAVAYKEPGAMPNAHNARPIETE